MTFFLLMWLLSLMNKYQLDGIAEYFKKPLKEAFTHASNKQNKDKDKDKNKEKEKEKEKEKNKEKPEKIDQIQHKLDEAQKKLDQKMQDIKAASSKSLQTVGIDTSGKMAGKNIFTKQEDLFSQMFNSQIIDIASLQKTAKQNIDNANLEFNGKTADKVTSSTAQFEKQFEVMKKELEKKLEVDPVMRQFKNQLNFTVTADGLRIELRDLKDKPMFSLGKTDFQSYAKTIISWLSNQLNTYPDKRVVIIGHTDAIQYQGDEYSNWELSADRANSTRRELIHAGMQKERILRIIGVGDTDLLDSNNGANPSNRRIEILILTDDAMNKIVRSQ